MRFSSCQSLAFLFSNILFIFHQFLPDCNCVRNSVHQSFGLMLSTHQYFSLLWRYTICCTSNIYHRNFLHSHFMFIYSDLTKALSHTFYHLLFYHLQQSLTTFVLFINCIIVNCKFIVFVQYFTSFDTLGVWLNTFNIQPIVTT